MTIRKRLFISNILMIVIPFFVSLVTFSVFVLLLDIFSGESFLEILRAGKELRANREVNGPMFLFSTLMFTCFMLSLFFFNRFLTWFMLKKIQRPIGLLTGGVRQISEGNLDYRIDYNEEDEFKQICEDFNEMAARLKASVEEAQRNDRNRKELLAGISHDLRTPLTSVKAYVEGLIDGVVATPGERREYLQIIGQKTDEINRMVSRLFLYSKMEMGNYPVHPETLNISNEIREFISASSDEYAAKGLVIETLSLAEGKYVYADPMQLRSVFSNIFENSAKYKQNDTVKMTVGCEAVNGTIFIVFADDGPGVPKEDLDKIFEVFYRGDPSRNNPRQGSGLGLAIAAKALELSGGSVEAENVSDGSVSNRTPASKSGLRLTIRLPERIIDDLSLLNGNGTR